ncbi:hypothetical protein ACFS5M_14015 [Lacinutrix iliipiscaria]|uniref:Uncharacterized protein n=1 Tax=Lacinutrix iliipiscaria TaxID=1230532 RepID=A0ABW5WR24_9FLAO
MKTTTKNEVKAILVASYNSPKAKFNAILSIFLKLDEVSPGQKRYFNAAGFSKTNLDALEYDIKKLCGIKDSELLSTKKQLKTVTVNAKDIDTPKLSEELKAQLNALDLQKANYNTELKPLAKAVSEALLVGPESQKKVDLIAYLEALKTSDNNKLKEATEAVKQLFVNAPEEVKTHLKLREEFPFLNDADCPDKFKILVADKRTAYYAYLDARDEIKKLIELGASNEELYELGVKSIGNFELNLEIYDELNYYNEHGEILGKHPIFADEMLNEKVGKLSTVELTKRQKNLRSYISRDSKKLDKMEAGEDKDAFEKKLNEFKHELELIDARLEKIS